MMSIADIAIVPMQDILGLGQGGPDESALRRAGETGNGGSSRPSSRKDVADRLRVPDGDLRPGIKGKPVETGRDDKPIGVLSSSAAMEPIPADIAAEIFIEGVKYEKKP